MNIKLTNSLTKLKEHFEPLSEKKLKLYVCGVTPYDYAHIGHGRCYVSFDLLVRLFQFLGYDVTYVRNYTDIDDKLINKALETKGDASAYVAIAKQFIQAYQKDMHRLRCLKPNVEPQVTQHIPQIIDFIEQLVEQQKAYVIDHDVYFDISTFPGYGKLSGRNIEDLQAGSRVKVDKRKKNPGDFALWKGNDEQLFWQSPWGHGRPAWHIECSVLAKEYLGETIDIHAGGMDLIFPHHENELAQSESLHKKLFSRYWLHNAFVNINKEKMSKSLGNIISLQNIFEQFDPMVLRYYFLQHHYRTPIDFSFNELESVQTAYKKLIAAFGSSKKDEQLQDFLSFITSHDLTKEMVSTLCDDLNSPKLLGIIFEHINTLKSSETLTLATRFILRDVLGLTLQPLKEKVVEITSEIEAFIKEREEARAAKDWTRADEIRDKLISIGYKIQDKKIN